MHTPLQQHDRIMSLDVIRGIALLGILLANSIVFQFGMLGSMTPVSECTLMVN